MSLAPAIVMAAAVAYLVGSLPFGYLTARWVAGIDIRRQGSGNIGATNIARVLGAKWGAAVLLFDCLKGLLPVLLLPALLLPAGGPATNHLQVVAAAGAVLGHMFPVWLGFRGGKGVATSLGVVLVISPWATLAAVGTFVCVVLATRIVSLGSMTAAASFAGFEFWLLRPDPFGAANWSVAAMSLLVPLLIIIRHRSNVVRLVQGREPRLGKRAAQSGGHSQGVADPRHGDVPRPVPPAAEARSDPAVADRS
jgi:acyl phosphate:glycerol-3-phosphate acyltransferase